MTVSTGKHEDVLVHDRTSNKTLCRVKDYPRVSLEQLNEYVATHGPLVHPDLGAQREFFVDEGRFVPVWTVVVGRCVIGPVNIQALMNWTLWSGHRGRVTNAQGEYVLDGTTLRVSDVADTPRNHSRQRVEAKQRTRGGYPFALTSVVEIDTLIGPASNLDVLDRKMRREYFPHGVQLGWLIDPTNKLMHNYYSSDKAAKGIDLLGVSRVVHGEILTTVRFGQVSSFLATDWTMRWTRNLDRRRPKTKKKSISCAVFQLAGYDYERMARIQLTRSGTALRGPKLIVGPNTRTRSDVRFTVASSCIDANPALFRSR